MKPIDSPELGPTSWVIGRAIRRSDGTGDFVNRTSVKPRLF
jgi:hypothetical protein